MERWFQTRNQTWSSVTRMNQTKNQMACAAPVAARRQATCRALPLKNHRRALKFSSGQVAGLPRRLPRKSQATLSHSADTILTNLICRHIEIYSARNAPLGSISASYRRRSHYARISNASVMLGYPCISENSISTHYAYISDNSISTHYACISDNSISTHYACISENSICNCYSCILLHI